MRGVSGFLHRYNLEDRRIPPSAMASEGSIAEMELLEFLAVITSSSPLERTVCVEGFAAVNGNVSAASIYGCGSPNIFKSVLAGHYATALHSLLYDKAWLAVDELNIMGVKFVIRQNSHLTSTYRVVEQSDGTSTRHTEIHSRANFSASGPLYCLVITTDIVLLLLHVHSALQIFRHALIPQLRRRQHAESVWDIVTGISERFAYAIARRAYVTTLELLGVGATVSYLIRDEVFAITTTKYDIDKQRYTDVFSFAGAVAYTNSYNDNQDAVWNTSWGLIGVVYKPLMRTIGLSILGLFLLYSFKLADYERLPLERLLNRPLRARSLIRTDLALETNINGELQLTIPTTFDSGFLVDDNGDLRPRRGFFDPIPASIDVRRLNAARRRRSASSTTVISLTGSDLLPAHRPLPRPPTFLQRLTTARARRHPTHLSSGNVPIR
ncbi:hypothetical protein Poli38472_007930 [Pythium oligandrum]|uniref:Uncharacterized protein n=1 Tax=Pythium oligandrum TaxID=41045 RepID=A0A8K1CN08_PYTOL|nr:hypothetical protein Poli38472_007930 [Pythium oligandrum]|eukprot:TMW65288.1 hypothetical protein Poli38472_007930 [Pythium oligandrum]